MEIVGAADGVAKAADRAVSRSFASPDLTGNAHGVSVFLPLELTEDTLAAYRVSRLAHASQWDELVAWLEQPAVISPGTLRGRAAAAR